MPPTPQSFTLSRARVCVNKTKLICLFSRHRQTKYRATYYDMTHVNSTKNCHRALSSPSLYCCASIPIQPNRILSLVFIVVHFIHLRTGSQRHFEKGRIIFFCVQATTLSVSFFLVSLKKHIVPTTTTTTTSTTTQYLIIEIERERRQMECTAVQKLHHHENRRESV